MDEQKRFTLALVLSALILGGYYLFFAKPLQEEARKQAQIEMAAKQETQTPVEPVQEPKSRDQLVHEGTRIKIDTPSMSGSFLTTGSRFDDLTMKKYKKTIERDSPGVTLLTPEGAKQAAYVLDNWTSEGGGSGANTPWELVSGSNLTPETPVVLAYSAENYKIQRTITIDDRYLITLADKVTNTSDKDISLVRKGAARQHDLPDELTGFFIIQEGPIAVVDDKLVDMKYKKLAKKRRMTSEGKAGWVGLTDRYWLTAAIAPQGPQMTADFRFRNLNGHDVYEAAYTLAPTTLSPGTSIESVGYIYAGAKARDMLAKYMNEKGISRLDLAIDYGLLGILTKPMSWGLTKLGKTTGNFGVAILLMTLILKIILFPLNNKAYASMAKMKLVQPKIKKMQKRYADDRMKLQQEMMALYRKEGVSPVAGCLPMIPQMFIFFALYKSLFITLEMRHAPFIGYLKDLSSKDPLSVLNGFGLFPWDGVPIGILAPLALGPLALLYGITMSLMQTLNTPPADKTQARIMQLMPIFFMFILAPFASGLLLYWVWNNTLTLIQQYIITRKYKVETPLDKFIARFTKKGSATANEK